MKREEVCPEEVRQRGAILYSNGFSGFQEPCESGSDKGHFILCWPHPKDDEMGRFENEIIPEVSRRTGVTTLHLGDWIGRDYLSIHWTEYAKRFAVLNEILQMGVAFQTQTKGMPSFKPVDGIFTQVLLEKRVMEQTRELVGYKLWEMIDDGRCEEWNWTTQEGKDFSVELKRQKGHHYDDTRENFYQWKLFQEGYDSLTLCSTNEKL